MRWYIGWQILFCKASGPQRNIIRINICFNIRYSPGKMSKCKKEHQLLCMEDSLPYELIGNRASQSPILIVCDHASRVVPLALQGLDIDGQYFEQHIGYDIGAAGVSRKLAEALNATAVLAGFSRLVIDPNRFLTAHDSIPSISDGIAIKGNERLTGMDRMLRIEELFIPYHYEINQAVSNIRQHFNMPLMMSVHSYTPVFQGFQRPWEIGVLWEGDDGVASMLLDYLRENTHYHVGENEPYHACNPIGYTVKTHAETKGYPHVLVEIRQDLIRDEKGQAEFAAVFASALEHVRSSLDRVIVRH